jgi:hypothetical protein
MPVIDDGLRELPAPPPEQLNSWLPDPTSLDPERRIDPAKLTIAATIESPGVGTGIALAVIVALLFTGSYALKRWVLNRGKHAASATGV